MTFVYILGSLIILLVVITNYKERKKRNTPYFQTRKRIENDIKYYTIIGDWRKVQELNIQNIWLDTILEINNFNYLEPEKNKNEYDILSNLTINDLKYPLTWNIDNFEHLIFVRKIIEVLRELIIENADKRVYKPDMSLPIPKADIKKAFNYFIEFLKCDEPILKFNEKEREALFNFIYLQRPLFDSFYLDTVNDDLPHDPRANIKAAQEFIKK